MYVEEFVSKAISFIKECFSDVHFIYAFMLFNFIIFGYCVYSCDFPSIKRRVARYLGGVDE